MTADRIASMHTAALRLCAVLACVCMVVLASACASGSAVSPSEAPTSAEPTASVEATIYARGVSVDMFAEVPGMPLQEALAQLGREVALPDASVSGDVDKAFVDETAPDSQGRPGLAVIYTSGVRLFVDGLTHDLSDLGENPATFTDHRKTALESAVIDGQRILLGQAGAQIAPGDQDVPVPAQVMWNQDGLGYRLVAQEGTATIDDLIEIMSSMQ